MKTDAEKIEAIRDVFRRPSMQDPEFWDLMTLDAAMEEISDIIDPEEEDAD